MHNIEDKAIIVDNCVGHSFNIGDIVVFEGLSILTDNNHNNTFQFKNTEGLSQVLVEREFEWLPNDNVIKGSEDWFFREKITITKRDYRCI